MSTPAVAVLRRVFPSLLSLLLCACASPPVPVAVVLPETGDWAVYGQSIREGVQVAEDYLREESRDGPRLKIRFYDTRSDADQALKALARALDGGAVAVIGAATSGEALQMIPMADRRKIVLISPSASAAQLAGMSRTFFRVYPSDQAEVSVTAHFIVENLEARNVAVFTQDNLFSRSIAQGLSSELKALEGGNVQIILLPPDAAGLQGAVRKGLEKRPQTVYLAAYSNTLIQTLRAVRDEGFSGSIVTTSAFNSPGILQRAGPLAEGIYYCRPPFSPGDAGNPVVKTFAGRFRERFNREPEVFAAYGFDALLVLEEALRMSGDDPAALAGSLRSVTNLQGATGPISFSPSGEVLKIPRIFRVQQGRAEDYLESLERYRSRMIQEIEKQKKVLDR
jgi:branched-chain amino acid transport system substrate-binding protein